MATVQSLEHYPFVNRSDEGRMLETSALKLCTVANLRYKLNWR